ncbi:MAG: hypothetical protein KGO96_13480 [Elusimicrobia bacterium]|nr:hypothetical protein [Elusimicrobiota bacterium]
MIPGINVNLGGTDYTVPPLNLRLFFQFEEDIAVISSPGQHSLGDTAKASTRVLLAVMQRNYPELTEADLLDKLDFVNLNQVVQAMFGQSGFAARPLAPSRPTPTPSPSPAPESSDSSTPPPGGSLTISSTD